MFTFQCQTVIHTSEIETKNAEKITRFCLAIEIKGALDNFNITLHLKKKKEIFIPIDAYAN